MKNPSSLRIGFVALLAAGLAGCAESGTIRANPVWSASTPDYGVEYSKTDSLWPLYSRNVTEYSDRIEESGSVLLFISWSKMIKKGQAEADLAAVGAREEPAGVAPEPEQQAGKMETTAPAATSGPGEAAEPATGEISAPEESAPAAPETPEPAVDAPPEGAEEPDEAPE